MADPVVSVIIPTYNRSALLLETLASVLAQRCKDAQVVVVDDGSTDDTRMALKPYADRITYVYQPNSGRSVARNTGVQHSSGEFITFLDSDDLLVPGGLQSQVDFLQVRPEVDVVYANGYTMYEDGTLGPLEPFVVPLPSAGKIEVTANILRRSFILPSTVMLRRRALRSTSPFDPSFMQLEDWDLWLRLACGGAHFMYNPARVAVYRRHGANTDLLHPRAHIVERTAICTKVIDQQLDQDLPVELRQLFRLEHLGSILRSRSPTLVASAVRTIVWPDGHLSQAGCAALAGRICTLTLRLVSKLRTSPRLGAGSQCAAQP